MPFEGPNTSSLLHTLNESTSSSKVTQAEVVISMLFNVTLMLAVIAGNGLILGAFAMNAHLRAVHSILIIGLASADFLVGVVSLPFWIYVTHCQHKTQQLNFYAYQFFITADIFIGASSILHLTGISIERCHAVMKPIFHKMLPRRNFYLGCAAAWLFAAIIAFLQPFQYRSWEKVYTILNATFFFFLPTFIIMVAYVCVFRRARSGPGETLMRHRRSVLAREIRLSSTVGMITVLFVLAWLPLFSLTMLATFNLELLPDSLTNQRLLGFVKWMHYSSSAINPFLYSYRNSDMRRTIKLIIHKHIMRKNICLKEVLPRAGTYNRSSFSRQKSRCRPLSNASQFSFGSFHSRSTSTKVDDTNKPTDGNCVGRADSQSASV